MTNSEAIELLQFDHYHLRKEINNLEQRGISQSKDLQEFEVAIKAIEENEKLKEELKESDRNLKNLCNSYVVMITHYDEKVSKLEDRLQQSIELSCKVGDKIYEIFCGKVNEYEIEKMNDVLIEVKHIEALDHTLSAFHSRHIGKDVFLTKEEAEIALKGEQ